MKTKEQIEAKIARSKARVEARNAYKVTARTTSGRKPKVKGENAEYTIASTPSSETQITLTSVYAGSGQSGAEYQITKDFTSNLEMPEIWAGDIDWPWHVTQALRTADTALADRKYQESNKKSNQ